MTVLPREDQRNNFIRLVFLTSGVVFVVLYTAWLIWGRDNDFTSNCICNLALIFTSLLAMGSTLWIQKTIEPGPIRSAWFWPSLGLGLWTFGTFLHLIGLFFDPGTTVRFTLVGIVTLAGSLPIWIGLSLYPRKLRQFYGCPLVLIDIAIVTLSIVTILWMAILRPLMTLPVSGKDLSDLLFLPFDLVSLLLLITIFMFSDPTRFPRPLGLFGLGLAVFALSDLLLASQLITGNYFLNLQWGVGWNAGNLLVVFASTSELAITRQVKPSPINFQTLAKILQRFLPTIAAINLAGYTLYLRQFYGMPDRIGLYITLVLMLILIARHFILTDKRKLQNYTCLINSMAEPAFICEPQGRVRLVNPAFLTAAGFSDPSSVIDKPLNELLPSMTDVSSIIKLAMNDEWNGDVYLRKNNGTSVPISLTLKPIKMEFDKRLAFTGTVRILNEQNNRQATIQQLEEQNQSFLKIIRMKSDLISLVSHEIRAPLTNIGGGIELLLATSKSIDEYSKQNLVLVHQEVKRLSRSVESILDLSAFHAGHMPLHIIPVSFQNDYEDMKRNYLNENGRIRWMIPPDLPPLLADKMALSNILLQLVDNACKYAPQGEIQIIAQEDGNRVRVDVIDSGPGIPEGFIPLIFDRFYRADIPDVRSIQGHGLGLYIVTLFLKEMNGEIQVSNYPGKGACFSFFLPIAKNE